MGRTKSGALFLLAGLVVGLVACQPAPPPDTRAADETAIRAAVAEWSKAAGAKDIDKFVSFYAPDASVFPPNAPIATGPEAIRKAIAEMLAIPGFALSFASTQVEVARAGDLAYEIGTYQLTLNDAKGKPVNTPGKYVVVWKKQTDGSWKGVADIFNPDR